MTKRNRYTPKQKLEIILEGLRGQRSITELCRKYTITSTMYYKWQDILLRKGEEIFATHGTLASVRFYEEKVKEMEHFPNGISLGLTLNSDNGCQFEARIFQTVS